MDQFLMRHSLWTATTVEQTPIAASYGFGSRLRLALAIAGRLTAALSRWSSITTVG
jgi:hypothetical protein